MVGQIRIGVDVVSGGRDGAAVSQRGRHPQPRHAHISSLPISIVGHRQRMQWMSVSNSDSAWYCCSEFQITEARKTR